MCHTDQLLPLEQCVSPTPAFGTSAIAKAETKFLAALIRQLFGDFDVKVITSKQSGLLARLESLQRHAPFQLTGH